MCYHLEIFINDILKICGDDFIQAYADDVVVYCTDRRPEVAQRKLQGCLNDIESWCRSNCLTVNTAKTKSVWYGTRRLLKDVPPIDVAFGTCSLPNVDSYTYLGVTLDTLLTFKKNFAKTNQVVNCRYVKLLRIRHLVPRYVRILIYKQTVLPILDFCSFLTDGYDKGLVDKLQRLQNRCLRACVYAPPGPLDIVRLHADCSVEFLLHRRTRQLSILMFKTLVVHNGINRVGMQLRVDDGRPIRKRLPRGHLYFRSPLYRGSTIWNGLGIDAQVCNEIIEFKKLV
jgi:hypothetical protein